MANQTESVTKKENNRIFNLIWMVAFGIVLLVIFLHPLKDSYLRATAFIYLIVSILEILIIILPKRNNFVSAFFLLILAVALNTGGSCFYNLSWLFYPSLDEAIVNSPGIERWFSAAGWAISFLTAMAFIYMFCSSIIKLFSKKSKCFVCFLVSLFLVGISSYLCFSYLPLNFALPQQEISKNINENVTIKFFDEHTKSQELTSVKTSEGFWIYAEGLQGNKRYGLRILKGDGKLLDNKSEFRPCNDEVCSFYYNGSAKLWKPDRYTIQVVAQEGEQLTVVGEKNIEVTELVVQPYEKGKKYPCEMWLTLGKSNDKLLRIEEHSSQKMLDIGVMVQCDGGTYNAKISVGTINQEVQYHTAMIDTADPIRVLSLGGNRAHGLVRLIVNDQVMGEAIIDRGFPICDNGKIVEGGSQSNCEQ